MNRRTAILLLLTVVLLLAFALFRRPPATPPEPAGAAPATLSVLSTIRALQQGHCEGTGVVRQVREGGVLGMAILNGLAAEIIVEDGKAFQIGPGGRLTEARDNAPVAFGVKSPFRAGKFFDMGAADARTFARAMAWKRIDTNHPHVYRLSGRFDHVELRVMAHAARPCPTLGDAWRASSTVRVENVPGRLLGFWFPPSLRDVAGDGYQFYFLDQERRIGGRVGDFKLRQGRVEVDAVEYVETAPRVAPSP